MAYPSKNSSTYTAPSRNSSTSTNSDMSNQFFFMIDDTYMFLIDSSYKLLIEANNSGWSYSAKS